MPKTRCLPLFLLLAALHLLAAPAIAAAEIVDRVVAVVNDDVITFSDLNREGGSIFKRITQQAPPDQVTAALIKARQEILSSLIDKLIVEQRAAKLDITVSDAELDDAVTRVLARNKVSREKFLHDLQMMGSSEREYRNSLRIQILQSKLVGQEIRSKVVITEEKIKEYYEKNYTGKVSADSYHILQMGFSWKDSTPAARSEALAKAEEARRLVLGGDDFRSVARKMSDLPSAADGGDIGVFSKGELSPAMKQHVLTLAPGQVSPIVETASGYQLFKLLSDKGNIRAQQPLDAVHDEIRDQLYQQAMDAQYGKWVKELRDEAYIKTML
ncbi:MAG TPA: peptidylprolyl isomerase [Desulfurivibrionaceae bacterium]|nr:peptidylprolyl isomerase [Desulfurivibrionaceae bacterium]